MKNSTFETIEGIEVELSEDGAYKFTFNGAKYGNIEGGREQAAERIRALKRPANRVMIAIPNLGHLHVNLVEVLLRWHFQRGSYETITLLMPRGIQPHDAARNYCVNAFLQTDFTHLFFLDSDVIPPLETLDTLLDADKDIIAGLYPAMKFRDNRQYKEMCVFNREGRVENGETHYSLVEAHGSGVQEIDRAGTGCLLIKREVFEKLDAPHFQFLYTEKGLSAVGEDINFCRKATEAGFKIYAHFGIICQHAKEILL